MANKKPKEKKKKTPNAGLFGGLLGSAARDLQQGALRNINRDKKDRKDD